MAEPKHSKGAWSFTVWGGAAPQEDHGKPASLCIDDEDGVSICQIADFDPCDHGSLPLEEQLANAHLLIAAPEMYAALRVAAEALDFARPSQGSPLHAILASAHKQAESALAKAEGREVQP